jgi:hypothetical protein
MSQSTTLERLNEYQLKHRNYLKQLLGDHRGIFNRNSTDPRSRSL